MAGPLALMARALRPAKARVVGRCPVCHDDVRAGSPALEVRGLHVHRGCASYRMRQRGRLTR